MIPGIASQIAASGSAWRQIAESQLVIAPLMYEPSTDRYFFYSSKSAGVYSLSASGDISSHRNVISNNSGLAWSVGTTGGTSEYTASRVSYENGFLFVPNATSTSGAGSIAYSNTPTATGSFTTTTTLANSPRFVIWQNAGNRWIAGGASGSWSTGVGTTSITWTSRSASGTQQFIDAASDGSNVIAIAANTTARLFTSATTSGSSETTSGLSGTLTDISYGNGTWAVVGSTGLCGYKTTVGQSWTVKNIGFGTGTINGICFYNNRWYAVGFDSASGFTTVRRSADQNITSNWENVYVTSLTSSGNSTVRDAKNLVSFATGTGGNLHGAL